MLLYLYLLLVPPQIGVSIDYSHRYPLRRETAVELSPSKPSVEGDLLGGAEGGTSGGGDSSDTSGAGSCGAMVVVSSGFQLKNERPWQRNSSMEQQAYPRPWCPRGPPVTSSIRRTRPAGGCSRSPARACRRIPARRRTTRRIRTASSSRAPTRRTPR